MRIVVLAGGSGGAMLAEGLDAVLPAGELTVIANTGDDVVLWGLHVSPDVDAVLYRLAGIFNEVSHWGIAEETFASLEMLRRLGEETWFGLGDRDLATHILRSEWMRSGMTLTEATAEIGRRLGVATAVIPMSDEPVRTFIDTVSKGRLSLQEYFVREGTEPEVAAVMIENAGAPPSPAAVAALESADLVVIGPSNPVVSIDPILSILGDRLDPARTVAVTPIVAGAALKGPTLKMLTSLGRDATPVGLATYYARWAGTFVLDARDSDQRSAIEALGAKVHVLDTVMAGAHGCARLARELLGALA